MNAITSSTDAIVALGFPPLVTETAIGLVEAWVRRYAEVDGKQTTLLVECPFVMEIDANAVIAGIVDRVAWSEEADATFGCEWKTTKEATKWWTEEKWLEERRREPQWRIGALAVGEATWVTPQGLMRFRVGDAVPFLLRGITKAAVPEFWPTNPADGLCTLTNEQSLAVSHALAGKVRAIRAMEPGGLPWQLPGAQCVAYNQKCEWYDDCDKGNVTIPKYTGPVNAHDETIRRAVEAVKPGFDGIVMTPTNYMLASSCVERWRRRLVYPTESSAAQMIGTATHAGLAHFYANDLPCAKGSEVERWMSKVG